MGAGHYTGRGIGKQDDGHRRTPVRPWCPVFLIVLFAMITPWASASETTLAEAERALNDNKPAVALELLQPLEIDLAGDTRFDYLYGLALLDSGNPGRAIFALERILAQDPDSPAARIELARAYYALDQLDDAEVEFLALRDLNPPPAAQRAINEYLDLIRTKRGRDSLVKEFELGLASGYDSNANSATTLPRFLGFNLVEESRETDSPFIEYSGNARLAKPLREGLLLDTRIALSHRSNADAGFVDSTVGGGSVGLRMVREGHSANLRLSGYRLNVDSDLNSQGASLNGSWEKEMTRNLRVGVLGRLGITRYDDNLEVKDVDQFLLGGNANWTFGRQRQGEFAATVLLGRDDAAQADSRYSRDIYGLRFRGGWSLTTAVRLTVSASGLVADYDDVFFEQAFESPREDTLVQAGIGLEWQISRNWLLRHLISHSRNITDVEIFEYDRLQVMIGINRLWR